MRRLSTPVIQVILARVAGWSNFISSRRTGRGYSSEEVICSRCASTMVSQITHFFEKSFFRIGLI
jgi:hypothetical protein